MKERIQILIENLVNVKSKMNKRYTHTKEGEFEWTDILDSDVEYSET
jgi:hypothetical protein